MTRKALTVMVFLVVGVMLALAAIDMPAFGDASAPAHGHVAAWYIEHTYEKTGVTNMVTAILADFRGYDTLGELTVIFTAGVAVWSLLMGEHGT